MKSSLNIPLLPEREEDKRMASLLSKKLKPTVDIEKNTALLRKQIICTSALPCSSFTAAREKRAIRLLDSSKSNDKTNNLVVRKSDTSSQDSNNINSNKKIKLTNSLVGDYGSSNSESE